MPTEKREQAAPSFLDEATRPAEVRIAELLAELVALLRKWDARGLPSGNGS